MANTGIRKPEKALTARFVDTVADPGKYFDGHGLFLRVRQNGAKQWVQRITIRGKRSEMGLGSPPAIPLAIARKLALEHRGTAMSGGDPLADRRKAGAVLTFENAVERYFTNKLNEFRNEKHRKQWRSTLDTYANPIIGQKRVSEITMQDVLRVLEPIWQTKTETAKRLRGRIENVLSWAAVAGYRTGDNPARWKGNLSEILPKPSKVTKSGNHPALALSDVPQWWSSLVQRDGMAAQALQFLTLTAARSGEVRGMTWDELDLSPEDVSGTHPLATIATWTIPAARMKAEREHRVPLTPQAVAILRAMPRLSIAE